MKKLNPIHMPWWAAIVQTMQYGHAGYTYISWIGIIIVGAMGALMSVVVAYSAARINDVAKDRKISSWFFFMLLMLVSPIFIGVAMYQALGVLGDSSARWIVAAIWGVIPDGSVALSGFITGKGLVEWRTSTKTTGTRTGTRKKGTGRTGKQSRTSDRSAAMLKKVECPHCLDKMTQGKLNAHIGKCAETNVFTARKQRP